MSKENIGFIERLARRVLPVAAVGMFAIAGCGGDKDTETIPEGLKVLHLDAIEICTSNAQVQFDAMYPDVEIGDDPSLEELQSAVKVLEAKESKGPAFMQGEYDDCMDREFNDVAASLENGTIVPTQDTVAPDTSIAG
jgi:hypothetical protein